MAIEALLIFFASWGLVILFEQLRRHSLALRINSSKTKAVVTPSGRPAKNVCMYSFRTILDILLAFALVLFIAQLAIALSCASCTGPSVSERLAQWTSLGLSTTCKVFVSLRWKRLVALAKDMQKIKSKLFIGRYKWHLLVVCSLQLAAAGCTQFGEHRVQLVGLILSFVCGFGATCAGFYYARCMTTVLLQSSLAGHGVPCLLRPCRCVGRQVSTDRAERLAGSMQPNKRARIFLKLLGTMQNVSIVWIVADGLWMASMCLYLWTQRDVEIATASLLALAFLLQTVGTLTCLWTPGPLSGEHVWQVAADTSCGACFTVLQLSLACCPQRPVPKQSRRATVSTKVDTNRRQSQLQRLNQLGMPLPRSNSDESAATSDGLSDRSSRAQSLAVPSSKSNPAGIKQAQLYQEQAAREPVKSVSMAALSSLLQAARNQHWAAAQTSSAQLAKVDSEGAAKWEPNSPILDVRSDSNASFTVEVRNPLAPIHGGAAGDPKSSSSADPGPTQHTSGSVSRENSSCSTESLPTPVVLPLPPVSVVSVDSPAQASHRRSVSMGSNTEAASKRAAAKRMWLAAKSYTARSRAKTEGVQALELADVVLDAMFWNLSCDVNGLMDAPEQLFEQ